MTAHAWEPITDQLHGNLWGGARASVFVVHDSTMQPGWKGTCVWKNTETGNQESALSFPKQSVHPL